MQLSFQSSDGAATSAKEQQHWKPTETSTWKSKDIVVKPRKLAKKLCKAVETRNGTKETQPEQ